MDRSEVESIFSSIESGLAIGGAIDLAGFWKAVTAVKRHPEWVDDFADRIGAIDRALFERWALVKVPLAVGTVLTLAATALGLVLIGLAYRATSTAQVLLLLLGTGVLMVSTHSLTHLIVGSLQGMRFTRWFIGTLARPQPGVKVDYASYLRVPPSRRAWMHASGALTTKLIPLVGLGAGWAMGVAPWVIVLLATLIVVQVLTDVVWSTKKSDWKKFRREMEFVTSRP